MISTSLIDGPPPSGAGKRTLVWPLLCCLSAPAAAMAAAPWVGRWEGTVAIPGAPMPIIIDLVDTPGPMGSMILPGRGVKGDALRQVAVDPAGALRLDLPARLGENARATLRRAPDGRLVGEFEQAGHRADLVLSFSGAAQVDPAPASSALPEVLQGTWVGGYQLGGYPREVTLTLSQPGFTGRATLLIVGRRRSEVPIDHVVLNGAVLQVVSATTGITLEGRLHPGDGSLRGQFLQGPLEADFVLRKRGGTP